MKFKKIIIIWTSVCLTALLLLFGSVAVFAAEDKEEYAVPTYKMSEQYTQGGYYERFIKTPISGDQAIDVISVALSQLGYHEGNGNGDLHGLNQYGSRDFVEYNVLVGKFDNHQGNGVSYGYSWCASFVNWCLRQARVPESMTGGDSFISCWKWRKACIDMGIYKEKDGYIPEIGDIIFFKDYNDPSIQTSASHVGLVLFSDSANVYTVEGNTSARHDFDASGDNVAVKHYPIDSKYIVGYGHPDYIGEGQVRGWLNVTTGSNDIITSDKIYENSSGSPLFRPVFTGEKYTVEFKNADGSLISKTEGFYGTKISVPAPIAPEGFYFEGWSDDIPLFITENASYTAYMKDTRTLGFVVDLWSSSSGKAMIIAAGACLLVGAVTLTLGAISSASKKRKFK